MHAVVDKSKKKRTKKETEDGCTATNNDQYAMPVRKMGKMTDIGEGVVVSSGVEEGEQCNDTVMPTYVDMLYAAMDKSCKKICDVHEHLLTA